MPHAPDYPDVAPDDPGPISSAGLRVTPGSSLTLWSVSDPAHATDVEFQVRISPDRPVIVGRAEGHAVPYLDPAYRATRVVPGTGQCVLQQDGHGSDICVSRGHFMLRAHPGGVVFVNGVPHRAGGIRPPLNGTWLLAPARRQLDPEEAYLIEHGHTAVFYLPNGTEIRIDAR
jgi:hypothetical protein